MVKINYNLKMEEIIKNIEKEDKKPKLLLQVCCAPCSSSVLSRLREYFDIDIFYYNPNIYPANELEKRVETVRELVSDMNLGSRVIFPENNPNDFYDYVNNRKNDHEGGESCYRCYELRLEKSAIYAKENFYDYFTTTLSISPYKNSAWLNEIGENLEEKYGIKYLYSDFKKKNGYKDSIDLSKKYNLYRQDYCGCIFSYREMEEKKKSK
ncbi:epoxyqueuosine reductase QueH [Anaerococcus senegalensis]|uniref:epoxyqueuosine reductase QueH n=1 Tax=Anaerococcus senegalensis TaxID=1288120 RepID=UPI00058B9BCD|nr:epoxyqueuosine reductase QueH [Anaerococcus senegalensis]